jgi:hypothetical protein
MRAMHMTNYPPGTSRRDLERAGIITHPVDCPECDATVNEGEDHEEWCECELTLDEMAEYWAEEQHTTEYDPIEHKDR